MFKIYFLSNYVLSLHKQEAILQKPWSSLQIHKKILLLGKETLGQCGEKGRKTRNATLGLLSWVPMSSPLPPIPGPRSREGQGQIPIQGRRGKSYWFSHARNLLISQSQHCSHPVSEQNVLCPIPNHHQVTERSREPLYHAQPNEPDQRYWNMVRKKKVHAITVLVCLCKVICTFL